MKFFLLITLSVITIASCHNKKETAAMPQPKELATFSGFDLVKVDFKENVFQLFSKVLMVDDERYDSAQIKNLDIEKLNYVSADLTGANLRVPKEKYGYLFQARTADSIARFDSIYFDEIRMLTTRDTSLVGVDATGSYMTKKADLDSAVRHMFTKYGQPVAQYFISSEFHICSYEWQLPDRIIQMKTSKGFSFSITSDKNTSGSSTYYKIDMLILKKSALEKLKEACTISVKKYPELKKFNWPETISGGFIPYSVLPEYKYDSLGIYSIDRAAENE